MRFGNSARSGHTHLGASSSPSFSSYLQAGFEGEARQGEGKYPVQAATEREKAENQREDREDRESGEKKKL